MTPEYKWEMRRARCKREAGPVWWWRVTRDGVPIAPRGLGWTKNKDASYQAAQRRIVEAREQDRAERL